MKKTTQTEILHTKIDGEAHPSVTPLYQNSAFQQQSPYFYTRKANPNSVEFENIVKTLEGAKHGISVATGMNAIAKIFALLRPGSLVVLNRDIYGCTVKLFQRQAKQRNLEIVTLDLSKPEGREQIPEDVDMVFFETPTNPFLRTIPIQEVADAARRKNKDALVVVDNSWATPLFQKPLQFGADLTVHSATKFFSGHSDVMGGIVLTDRDDIHETISDERFYTGSILAPHSAWLLNRSMKTFIMRMREHERVTREMASFLEEQSEVDTVYMPHIDGKQLTGYGGILFFTMAESVADKSAQFVENLTIFTTGTGMAAVTSMVARPYYGSHASLSEDEKKEADIGPELIRLCFGLEAPEDLRADILAAFANLKE